MKPGKQTLTASEMSPGRCEIIHQPRLLGIATSVVGRWLGGSGLDP